MNMSVRRTTPQINKNVFGSVGRTTFSNGRIHFRDARRNVLGQVVQEEPADVEERLRHVGAEGLVLESKNSPKEGI